MEAHTTSKPKKSITQGTRFEVGAYFDILK
jgi:hypothetical protein